MMNILILSAGTRCQLVNYFMTRENGFDTVVTTDCSKYAPAIYKSDKHYIVPRMKMPEYLLEIKKICQVEKINVILPLQEDELVLIANHRSEFEAMGILVCISQSETVNLCRDKYKLYKHLRENEISVIPTYDYGTEKDFIEKMELPVIMKNRGGAGSEGNLKINSRPLLQAYADNTDEELIVQPYCDGEEFGVDTYVDCASGEVIAIFAKEKIRMRAGETEKSRSVVDDKLFDLVNRVVSVIDFRGPIDMDIFKCGEEYHVLEINPRFGGGYPHAYECGVNFIKYIACNASGKENMPNIGAYTVDKVLLKYTDAALYDEEEIS